ncbi:MAG: hypothetical protein IPK13_18555 [Deltaproteobacteria bacterium]|nr:hypothetical protein [Deltaproteobacteria bacterium]
MDEARNMACCAAILKFEMSQSLSTLGSSGIEEDAPNRAFWLIGRWVTDTLDRWPAELRWAPDDEIASAVARVLIGDPAHSAALRRLTAVSAKTASTKTASVKTAGPKTPSAKVVRRRSVVRAKAMAVHVHRHSG